MDDYMIRPAKPNDSRFVWEIRYNPKININALATEVVDFSEHDKWFKKKYFDNIRNKCFILSQKTKNVGYCRLDERGREVFFVSIAIAPSYQGKGYGSVLLRHSIMKFGVDKNIFAEIKVSNMSSQQLFKKNNFSIYKKNKDIICFKFKKEKKLNVAIVGAGRIGAFLDKPGDRNILTHAHAFTSHGGFKLIGFVDRDFKQAISASKIWGGRAYHEVGNLFKNERVDVVCVATPDDTHDRILKILKNYPLMGVMAEKPLTNDIKQSLKLGRDKFWQICPIVVNYSLRYTPGLLHLKEEIIGGKYGTFICGQGYYGKGLLHNGSHLLDLLSFFGVEVKDFMIVDKIRDYDPTDLSVSALLHLKGGGLFNLTAVSARHYTIFEIDLIFTNGRVRILNGGQEIEIFGIIGDKKFAGYRRLVSQKQIKTGRLNQSMYMAVDNLYNAIVKKDKIVSSVAGAVKVHKLCFSMQKADI